VRFGTEIINICPAKILMGEYKYSLIKNLKTGNLDFILRGRNFGFSVLNLKSSETK
jgi:hypothetical protein